MYISDCGQNAATVLVWDIPREWGVSEMPEYRGTQYQIVRTANPTGYRWTAYIDGNRTRSGACYTRESAVYEVKRAIAKFVSATRMTASLITDPAPASASPSASLSDPD
jgi:hypothetical protein